MQTMTLLEIVQSVLSGMDDDDVSDIGDTVVSEQIVKLAKEVYNQIMSASDWKHLKKVTQLDASGDSEKPTSMYVPDTVAEIVEIRYNVMTASDVESKWRTIEYLGPDAFLDLVHSRDDSASNTSTPSTDTGVLICIYTDRGPTYYTSFDDNEIIFDAYDSGIDTTLTAAKSVAEVIHTTTWTNDNSFVPDMPARLFPTYLAKLKTRANEELLSRDLKGQAEDAKFGFNRLRRKVAVANPVKRRNYGRNRPQ